MTDDLPFRTTRRWRSAWLAAALLVAPASAHAEDCRNATSQAQLDQCANEAFVKSNGALNAKYKAVMERLSGQEPARKQLVAAQEAWLRYRDSECTFESSDSVGGSMHPMVVLECRTGLTDARSRQLQHFLSCTDGDMACPLPPR